MECNYKGTTLRFRINTDRISTNSEMVYRYKKEDFEAAKKFAGKDAISPSIVSTMLSRDF